MSDSNNQNMASRLEFFNSELQVCRRKLESKCEALLIISRELDQCRSERDQFKLMAEQLRDRYQMMKRQLTGDTPMYPSHVEVDPKTYSDIQAQSIARLLFDTKESNKALKFQVDDLKQKLQDAEGDIKLLREQIARSRVGTTDEGLNTRHFPAHEREALVKELEASREEMVQLQRDLQQVLDEKEELVTERDAYRTKHEHLNTELNYILGGDDRRIVDIDALNMENKFLQERLKQMEEEKSMAIATVTKYKSILEKRKTRGILKLGQSRSGSLVISQKQVQEILQSKSSVSPSPQALADLQGLCSALVDSINDKNLALSHQRKTNKLLGNRVNELEKKLKTLEVSGLWSVSGQLPNLEKLKAECEDIKTLVPMQLSSSHSGSEVALDGSDLDSLPSSMNNSAKSSPAHRPGETSLKQPVLNQLSHLDLEELDLLPTKEEVVKGGEDLARGTSAHSSDFALDGSLGLSGTHSQGTYGLEGFNQAPLHSLVNDRQFHTTQKPRVWDLGCFDLPGEESNEDDASEYAHLSEEAEGRLSTDSEAREATIMKLLRKDTEEEEEESRLQILGVPGTGDAATDEDDDDAGVYEETNAHLQDLLASVTSKLLERASQNSSQDQGANGRIHSEGRGHFGDHSDGCGQSLQQSEHIEVRERVDQNQGDSKALVVLELDAEADHGQGACEENSEAKHIEGELGALHIQGGDQAKVIAVHNERIDV